MFSNQANAICVYLVLRDYSDHSHIMSMREITAKLSSIYGLTPDRRTVYSAVDLLISLGCDISTYEENKKGYYLRTREFETSEVHMLMDAVYSHQAISPAQTQKLIAKLQTLLSVHERIACRHLSIVKTDRKTNNQEVFLNIEILDEAIQRKVKVQFVYLSYGLDIKLHPRREKKYTVNPYRLICTNEHYYLLCRMAHQDNLSMYRVDLMRETVLTEYPLDSALTEDELLMAENDAVYAWVGDVETIELRCKKHCIGDLIDKFGTSVKLFSHDADTVTALIRAVPAGVKFWALQYLPYVEVLRPVWLREEIIESIRQNPYNDVISLV